ncbi:ricin-type beta-trefoil lectin domain protein [Kitasatospora sp. NBC_01560]|uniref:ricin-type beta-trefoil lectin domain protein n=1 Tax=Kitasatospora sp. NBC_01560 TaxID=2975965 RepID=UPI0038686632
MPRLQPPAPRPRSRNSSVGRLLGPTALPVACAAVLALGAGLLVAPTVAVAADRGHGPADASWPAPPAKPAEAGQAGAVQAARAKAKETGRAVVIDALTGASSQTSANPDGTLTTSSTPVPERAKGADGSWRPVDATLRSNADGTVTPTAVGSALSFSGGGNGPMATMTTSDGKKLALTAPFGLPKPELSGDSALYRSVLPDVDLQLTATTSGGWRQVLVVRTARAAVDPRIRNLHLDVTADGLSVNADAGGNLTAVDAAGAARFTAPSPVLWDSTVPAATEAPALKAAPKVRGKSAEAPPADSALNPVATVSSAKGPGDGATVAPIAATVTGSGIDLVPDTAALGKGTGPWYIDPGWNPSIDNGTQAWAQVQEAYPDSRQYNSTKDDQDKPAAGYCGYIDTANPCPKVGRTRAYFQVGFDSRLWDTTILNAKLYANVVRSSSPSTPTPMGLYTTPVINEWTRWDAQPCQTDWTMQNCSKVVGKSISGTGGVDFDVTGEMQRAAREHWPNWTFGFAPDDEKNKYYRQRFANNPHLAVTYDIAPHIGTPAASPTPGFARDGSSNGCATPGTAHPWDNPGWVGVNTDVNLSVDTWSPTGEQLWTTFKIWDDDNGGASQIFETGWMGGSGRVSKSVGPLTDGHQYGWFAVTGDGTLNSPNSDMCFLRIDRTPPTARVTSTDFPESGTLGAKPKLAGQPGVFTLTGTDPVPAGGARSSGLACARWTTDPVQAAATGWKCTDNDSRIVKIDNGFSVNVTITPNNWGTNFVFLQTQDNAGNMSQPVSYSYYAPTNPNGPAPILGDIDGDKKSDVLLPDSAGNLRMIGAGADPYGAPNAKPQSAPGTTGWDNIQITHRGSFSDANVDDLVAHAPGSAEAYLYVNDRISGRFDGQAGVALAKPTSCMLPDATPVTCSDWGLGADWSKVTDIAAFGSPTGDTPDILGTNLPGLRRTSLLFREGSRLWLAMSSSVKTLDGPVVLLSGTDQEWDFYDLITPGPTKGTDMPTLWSRSRGDGTIHAFQLKPKPDGTLDASEFTTPTKGWIANGVDRRLYPKVGSNGDLTGDGVPDLWAVDTNQQLVAWSGVGTKAPSTGTAVGPTVTGLSGTPVVLGNLNRPTASWLAAPDGSNNVPDGRGQSQYAATAAGVGWSPDTVNGKYRTVAGFSPAAGSNITAAGPVVDTRKSFTVSLWAKSGPNGGIVASQTAGHASDFIIYNDGGTGPWRFAVSWRDTTGWPFHYTDLINSSVTSRPGVWTQLTASYNSVTSQMSLYVDGVLAGTGIHNAGESSVPSGPFVLGRYKANDAMSGSFDGALGAVAVYPFAVSPSAPGTAEVLRSGVNAGMCVDDAGSATGPDNPVQLYGCNGTAAQQVSVGTDGTLRVLGGCLTAQGAGTGNGTKIVYRACDGTPSQIWAPTADNRYYHPASTRCLDLPGWNAVNGNQLQLWDCHTGASQQWTTTLLRTPVIPAPPQ